MWNVPTNVTVCLHLLSHILQWVPQTLRPIVPFTERRTICRFVWNFHASSTILVWLIWVAAASALFALLNAVLFGEELGSFAETVAFPLWKVGSIGCALGEHRSHHVPLAVVEQGRFRHDTDIAEVFANLLFCLDREASFGHWTIFASDLEGAMTTFIWDFNVKSRWKRRNILWMVDCDVASVNETFHH